MLLWRKTGNARLLIDGKLRKQHEKMNVKIPALSPDLPHRGRCRPQAANEGRCSAQRIPNKGAVRKVCRCEPVTDVTGVAAPRLNGNSLVLLPNCLKIRGIATPVCGLVRNDRLFSNSPHHKNIGTQNRYGETPGEYVPAKAHLKGIEAVAACGLRTLNAERSCQRS